MPKHSSKATAALMVVPQFETDAALVAIPPHPDSLAPPPSLQRTLPTGPCALHMLAFCEQAQMPFAALLPRRSTSAGRPVGLTDWISAS